MKFLLDHCIPKAVANVLSERGHEVLSLTDVLPQNSPDPVVAKVAQLNRCVLVAQDRDFKKIVNRIPDGVKNNIKQLSRISLQCISPKCVIRISAAMSFVEFEWYNCQTASDPRMFITIGDKSMRTSR